MSNDYNRSQLLTLQVEPVLRDLITLARETRELAAAGKLRTLADNLRRAADEIEQALDRPAPTPPAAPANVIPHPHSWGPPEGYDSGTDYQDFAVS